MDAVAKNGAAIIFDGLLSLCDLYQSIRCLSVGTSVGYVSNEFMTSYGGISFT
jgi:hypothetical protein